MYCSRYIASLNGKDPNPYQKSDPDKIEKQDPDPYQNGLDPQHWYGPQRTTHRRKICQCSLAGVHGVPTLLMYVNFQ